ncbi:MAG: PAS domain-containing protein [Myxococcota bacterium]
MKIPHLIIDEAWDASLWQSAEILSFIDGGFRLLYLSQGTPEVIGRSVFDFVAEEYQDTLRDAFMKARQTGFPQHFMTIADSPEDGTPAYFSNWVFPLPSVGADVTALVGIDITHTKRIEDALSVQQQTLETLTANIPDSIFIVDREQVIRFVNYTLEGDVPPAQTIGQPMLSFRPLAQYEKLREAIDAVIQTGQPRSVEMFLDRDAGRMFFSTRVGPILKDGRVEQVMLISTNITDQKQGEDQLLQAQKMEALGEVTSGIAHDFNNLLTIMMGNLDLLLDEQSDLEEVQELAAEVRQAVSRASQLTDHLLTFARRQVHHPQACRLDLLLAQEAPILSRILGRTVQVRVHSSAGLWTCHLDPAQMQSALLNLCVNARDAVSGRGTITLSTDNLTIDQAIAADLPPGEWVRLSVRDDGVGMEADVIARATEPFFTTKGAQGTGLGLSMVNTFVRHAQGHLRIHSVRGQGTDIQLFFPRDHQDAVGDHP